MGFGPKQSDITAIKAKTDNLPSDPASESGKVADVETDVGRKYPFLDFWSAPADLVTVTSTPTDIDFPNIVVSGLPSGLTIQRVVLIFTCRAIKDTSAVANYINGASKTIRIKKSTSSWGSQDLVGITFDNQSLYCDASTKESGLPIIGDTDVKAEVDGNATYNVESNQTNRSDAIVALGNDLEIYDVQVGVRVYYS